MGFQYDVYFLIFPFSQQLIRILVVSHYTNTDSAAFIFLRCIVGGTTVLVEVFGCPFVGSMKSAWNLEFQFR